MRKSVFVAAIIFALILTLVYAASLTKEEQTEINECRKDCTLDKRESLKTCSAEGKACLDLCKQETNICKDAMDAQHDVCVDVCQDSYNAIINNSPSTLEKRNATKALNSCKRSCFTNMSSQKREFCDYDSCRSDCSDVRRECVDTRNTDYQACTAGCRMSVLNESVTCENGRYSYGQIVLDGCKRCSCNSDGKLRCESDPWCNFKNMTVEQTLCDESGGKYHQLCAGNIYAMRCTNEFYCLCDGNANFTCPANHYCLKEFHTNGIIRGNLKVWADKGGKPLGDIGLCAQMPALESCGNGVCEDVTCASLDCPVAETDVNCPVDCH